MCSKMVEARDFATPWRGDGSMDATSCSRSWGHNVEDDCAGKEGHGRLERHGREACEWVEKANCVQAGGEQCWRRSYVGGRGLPSLAMELFSMAVQAGLGEARGHRRQRWRSSRRKREERWKREGLFSLFCFVEDLVLHLWEGANSPLPALRRHQ
ncbi:hypothetical protein GOP47_0014793 [Adiantum capillus-veneris]|uniref:Uncharacterized protein n=1 Tax=Adiantum capillus-veneris TaxID=13818 RepID=A0A9D4ZEJ8_ADICA|nr:hypothetical protein GOP47_0014793 [Adiantum capillus-veneris]